MAKQYTKKYKLKLKLGKPDVDEDGIENTNYICQYYALRNGKWKKDNKLTGLDTYQEIAKEEFENDFQGSLKGIELIIKESYVRTKSKGAL